ncbi:MAG: chitobiase/beta-hexosaminidase C-terminal domain-containing protein [Clostridia bacterium]|nr:chitobiase/beta-hexosaminidase C-terminal domain-containing protein [Clostridia bacterium]
MLCPFCGYYGTSDDVVCPSCGKLLPRGENRDSGVMAIRQGKRAREEANGAEKPIWMERQGGRRQYVDPDTRPTSGGQIPLYSDPDIFDANGEPVLEEGQVERRDEHVYGDTAIRDRYAELDAERDRQTKRMLRRRNTNWQLIAIIVGAVIFVILAGSFLFITRTFRGHVFLMTHWMDSNDPESVFYVSDPQALWYVGEERMNTGDFSGAITLFERASELDADDYNVAGNLMLAKCYEATGTPEKAEQIYVYLYTEIAPSNAEAYTNEIRLMLADGREAEAAELMRIASTKTSGGSTFTRQRNDLLPSQPKGSFTAGTFEYRRTLYLTSPEGFDIYYTINDPEAPLPDEGELYDPEKGIFLDEGEWAIRAVCVNGELVSDVLSAKYMIDLPSPRAPTCNLAPGTYERKQRVRLRPAEENKNDADITIYYTIDGSIPDADSPVYDGNPVELPTGTRVVLQAVAVNRYGKPSHTFERLFKINGKNGPKSAYASDNPSDIGSVRLNHTTYESFFSSYAEAQRYEDMELANIGPCRRFHYPWGYATFRWGQGSRLLMEIYYETSAVKGPRNTTVGMSMDAVVGSFRDMGQVESPSGNRGLYSNEDGTGKIFKEEKGTYLIRYIAFTADSHSWQLDYHVDTHGTVDSIYQIYIP